MTKYLLGECDAKYAELDPNKNSYGPSFQHVFTERIPSSYQKMKITINGEETYRFLDIVKRRFVSEEEILDKSRILD